VAEIGNNKGNQPTECTQSNPWNKKWRTDLIYLYDKANRTLHYGL